MCQRHVFVFLFIAVCTAQFTSREFCRYIEKFDCLQLDKEIQCGTDGNNYFNDCDFSQAHCKDRNLHRANLGLCATAVPNTGNATTAKPTDGEQIALDIFCLDLFHFTCNSSRPLTVCASDKVTYNNLCEFDKRRCTHRTLHIVKYSAC